MTERVLILRDEVSLTVVHALAELQAWELREETGRAHLLLTSRRWSTPMGEEITYVADHPGGAQWLRVSGSGASSTADRLRGRIPCEDEAELLAMVMTGDPILCVRAAAKLAACRPERVDTKHLEALTRLLEHPEVAVRRAGIRSAYGCRWKELRGLVERRAGGQELRLRVQLEGLRQHLAGQDVGQT